MSEDNQDLPDLDALIARRDRITSEITRLTLRRSHVEGLISSVMAFQSDVPRVGTFDVVRKFFSDRPGETVTVDDMLKYALANGWRTSARDRVSAMRSGLSRMVLDGELARANDSLPARYKMNRPGTSGRDA